MSALDRYLAREILLPFGAGLLFLTQLLLATQLLSQGDVLLGAGASFRDLGLVCLDLLPHLMGYVLPVAFLLGAVVGVGRLAEDRELVALSAAGLAPSRLVRVPLALGALASAAALVLSLQAEPAGLRAARARLDDLIKRNVTSEVRSGTFFEEIPDVTLYAEKVQRDGWRHVLVSDRSDPAAPLLALAEGGKLRPAEGGTLELVLTRGEAHREELAQGEYVTARFRQGVIDVGVGQTLEERNRLVGSPFELTPGEIVRLARRADAATPPNPEEARRWRTFLHRRIAGPLALLAFALLAVPIAASRRGGRAFGYVATLLAVVGYYAVLRVGEGLSQRGALPYWLGPELANLACAAAGLAAIALTNRRGAGAVR
ncbi:LptF/LptG family permease [Anaeromyxobacter paludicola]|uniref:LPS export ABC transporter permease LptF n=1 Tax=Anaeromyxobacter paludicola TaxID=2918171 RepID=A0ABN6N539_9BACT|nr:LptF/LptG family permease [Anaeromyxobacter paludicola]BDG07155.1 LPS export ABC transporter permease LptF [Anaeromyxobacter paludicola]